MQLIDICTNAIALFGAVYFLLALAAHLHHCWVHPPIYAPSPAKLRQLTIQQQTPLYVAARSPMLLLPPAVEPHPFEMSLEKMPALEPIPAVHQPVAEVEPPIELPPIAQSIDVEELLEAIDIEPPSDYAHMTIRQLKALAREQGVPLYSSKGKAELIAALS